MRESSRGEPGDPYLAICSYLKSSLAPCKHKMEKTLIFLKPEASDRGLIGAIISRFENKGYVIEEMKTKKLDEDFLRKHYSAHVNKPFFPEILGELLNKKVIAMIIAGPKAVNTCRMLIGATDPLLSAPGTIRGDFSCEIGRNMIHGSDSLQSAKDEISLWFPECVSPISSSS